MKNLLGINAERPLCHCFGCLGVWGHLDVFHLIHTGEQTTHIFVGTDHFYLGVLCQTKRTYIYKYTCTYVHLMKVCFYVLCLWDKVQCRYTSSFLGTKSLCENNLNNWKNKKEKTFIIQWQNKWNQEIFRASFYSNSSPFWSFVIYSQYFPHFTFHIFTVEEKCNPNNHILAIEKINTTNCLKYDFTSCIIQSRNELEKG